MKEVKGIKITTYETHLGKIPGFMIDIIEQETEKDTHYYEAWIWHRDFGTKLLMFGMDSSEVCRGLFFKIVADNIKAHSCRYLDEVMDED